MPVAALRCWTQRNSKGEPQCMSRTGYAQTSQVRSAWGKVSSHMTTALMRASLDSYRGSAAAVVPATAVRPGLKCCALALRTTPSKACWPPIMCGAELLMNVFLVVTVSFPLRENCGASCDSLSSRWMKYVPSRMLCPCHIIPSGCEGSS